MPKPFVKISIIIPVLNEEKALATVLNSLQSVRSVGHEVVVADGGSVDNSLLLAHEGADHVIVSKVGRAIQMNSGAAVASGKVFLFLHCDTLLPDNALLLISGIQQTKNYWGRFDVTLSSKRLVFRLIEKLMNFRSRVTAIATGDQAIFIESGLFNRINGFPEIALMEDIAISSLLKKIASPFCFKEKVISSSRRWENNGVVKTVLLMWKLRLLYFFGVSPDKLNQLYR